MDVTETFYCDPEGSTPSRQRRSPSAGSESCLGPVTDLLKRRQRALTPCGSLEIMIAEVFIVLGVGTASGCPLRPGHRDSTGVSEHGIGAGRVTREPVRSRCGRGTATGLGGVGEEKTPGPAVGMAAAGSALANTKGQSLRKPKAKT